MKLLFVCKYNRFRSKTAEAFFKKINKNKRIQVKSAGLIKGNRIPQEVLAAGKELGINIRGQPHGLSSRLLQWQGMAVIVADDVPAGIFKNKEHGKPLIVWKIKDTSSLKTSELKAIMKKVMKKVESLAAKLKNAK